MTFVSYRANCSRDVFISCMLCLYANQIKRPESRNGTENPVYLNDTKFIKLSFCDTGNTEFCKYEIIGKLPKRVKLGMLMNILVKLDL